VRPILLAAAAARRPGDVVPLLRDSFGVPRRAMGVQELVRLVRHAIGARAGLGLRSLLPVCLGRYRHRLPASTLADLALVAAHYRCDEWLDRAVGELVLRRRVRHAREHDAERLAAAVTGIGAGTETGGISTDPEAESKVKNHGGVTSAAESAPRATLAVLEGLVARAAGRWKAQVDRATRSRNAFSRGDAGTGPGTGTHWAARAQRYLPGDVSLAMGAVGAPGAETETETRAGEGLGMLGMGG